MFRFIFYLIQNAVEKSQWCNIIWTFLVGIWTRVHFALASAIKRVGMVLPNLPWNGQPHWSSLIGRWWSSRVIICRWLAYLSVCPILPIRGSTGSCVVGLCMEEMLTKLTRSALDSLRYIAVHSSLLGLNFPLKIPLFAFPPWILKSKLPQEFLKMLSIHRKWENGPYEWRIRTERLTILVKQTLV